MRSEIRDLSNPYHDDKVSAACAIFGMIDRSGQCVSGDSVITAITNMHERGNGLGGGFAIYGLYPGYEACYAFHILYMNPDSREAMEEHLRRRFRLVMGEEIPTRPTRGVVNPPLLWRYFLTVNTKLSPGYGEDDYVVDQVMEINRERTGAFVISSGKNMGVFKGVGFPEQIAEFFRLDDYAGYLWTAHARFPTNTTGWWGGAHPFDILDCTVVHNGEISSYGINRRYLEMYGYECTMETDTEVLAYAIDLLVRRHGLPIEIAATVLAPPLWSEIEQEDAEAARLHTLLRQVYPSLLMNGPFAIIVGRTGEMMGLTDRIRLRPMIAAAKGPVLYLSSEEAAIHLVCPDIQNTWTPLGGEPVIGRVMPGATFTSAGEVEHVSADAEVATR